MTKAELLAKQAENNTEVAAQILAQNCNMLELCVFNLMVQKMDSWFAQKYALQQLTYAELKQAITLASND